MYIHGAAENQLVMEIVYTHSMTLTYFIPKLRFGGCLNILVWVPSGLGRYVPLYKEPIGSFLLASSHGSNCSHDILSIPPHPLFLNTVYKLYWDWKDLECIPISVPCRMVLPRCLLHSFLHKVRFNYYSYGTFTP